MLREESRAKDKTARSARGRWSRKGALSTALSRTKTVPLRNAPSIKEQALDLALIGNFRIAALVNPTGRIGWWWFADGFWYWYDNPVYPYPDYVGDYYVPSDSYAPPDRVWYYCDSAGGYYPDVPRCPTGWRTVPAEGDDDAPP